MERDVNRKRRQLLLAAAASSAVASAGWAPLARAQANGRGKALLVGNTSYNPS
ncbi:MAG: hypothetical protein JWQ11_74, partial [Rhizobacter sp.]|nr:hypothetical protein [Rhizobacter sp.]